MTYKVKLDIFEGPFDLLVYLIENARMNIYDIQVAEITSQYLDYVNRMKQAEVSIASEFMVLAAVLIEIKSKMLLPRVKIDDEGNLVLEDPRIELADRLLEYKKFKNAAEMLERRGEDMRKVFEKPKEDLAAYTNEPDFYLNLDLKQFVKAFKAFIIKKKRIEDIHKTVTNIEIERHTVESKMEFIRSVFGVKDKKTVNFKELLQRENDRYEVALTFSSILEMAKQKTVRLKQPVPFGEITITEGAYIDDREAID